MTKSASANAGKPDTARLFDQYLSVVNRAIEENQDHFSSRVLRDEGEVVLGDQRIGVAIYRGVPAAPHRYVTIELDDGSFDVLEHGKQAKRIVWRLSESHLRQVVEDPDSYIEAPGKLDLNWIKTQVALH